MKEGRERGRGCWLAPLAQAGKHGMKRGPPGLGRPNSPVGWVTLSKLPARTFGLSSVSGKKTVHLTGLKVFAANMLSVMCDVTVMVTGCAESCFHGCYCASLTIYHCCPHFIKQVSVGFRPVSGSVLAVPRPTPTKSSVCGILLPSWPPPSGAPD